MIKLNTDLFFEHNVITELREHSGLVTAIMCIDDTPYMISSDDHFFIKLWDIRKGKCL